MKQLFVILALSVVCFAAAGQDTRKSNSSRKSKKKEKINAMIKQEEEGVISFKKHWAIGGKLTTDGYGAFFEKGFAKSVKKASLVQLEITERKHQKEEKQSALGGGLPFKYGKINFFYPIKLGFQQQFLLGNKSNKNGVSITANVGGGIALGLLRPYTISMADSTGKVRDMRYDSEADQYYFMRANIDPTSAGPGLSKGWKYLKMTPGLYLKTGLRFDYGKFNEMLNAIEVGLTGEFYSKKIPQMILVKQKQFFFGAYFALMMGRRK
ncbi:MAG: hypothetical protein U0X40_05490 [Ferruginibacter sp.]